MLLTEPPILGILFIPLFLLKFIINQKIIFKEFVLLQHFLKQSIFLSGCFIMAGLL